jgi:hypothetical protein
MRARLSLALVAGSFFVLAGCGPQPADAGGEDVDASSPAPGAPDAEASGNSECEATPQCPGDRVCDRDTGECTDALACSTHADCGDAAHCSGANTCRKSATGSPCDDASDCRGGDACQGGFCGCQGAFVQIERVPVNMLLVVDRSVSMLCHIDDPIGEGGLHFTDADSRWQVALGAVDQLLASYADRIDFGLAVYPGTELAGPVAGNVNVICDGSASSTCDDGASQFCAVGDRLVDVQSGAASAIRAALADPVTSPHGCTPSGAALQAQLGYEGLANPDAENYILYLTDGVENCGATGAENQVSAIEALRAQEPDVRTFVVGFTEDVNPAELTAAAEAGGMARDGAPNYYQADDAAALETALAEIGALAVSCSFALDTAPDDLEDLFVYVDRQSIVRDPTRQDGWDYDPQTQRVTLYGGACDALRGGDADDVTIVYGCPLDID